MSPTKNRIFTIVKWFVMLAAYGFLIVKLARIEYWNELKENFQRINSEQILILTLVFVLLPVNWWLEAVKWQRLMTNSVKLSIRKSYKSVLAGTNTGYVTPNRIGDFAGRILFLSAEHRVTGVVMSVINSITLNIVITIFGVWGAIVFFSQYYAEREISNYLFWTGIGVLVLILILFTLPKWISKLKFKKWNTKLKESIQSISQFKSIDFLLIILISALRYFVFCTQYFLMLHFFQIEISVQQALFAIPTMYLLITFTPSLAASEPAVRGSYAVLIFSTFSSNIIGVMLAGILIWLINFVVPMIAGTVVIGRIKKV